MPKWRKPSVFGPGRRVPIDRNQLARFVWLVRNDRRYGRLSATGEDVAIELVKMLGDDDQAALPALIAAGRGDAPVTELRFRCGACGSRTTSVIVSGSRTGRRD